jgi:hypothetical protein
MVCRFEEKVQVVLKSMHNELRELENMPKDYFPESCVLRGFLKIMKCNQLFHCIWCMGTFP